MGQQSTCYLRHFGNAKDLGGLDLDPRTIADAELSITQRHRELPLIHEPEHVFVRVVAPGKHPDRLRHQGGVDPIPD